MPTDETMREKPTRVRLGHAGRKLVHLDRPPEPRPAGPRAASAAGRLLERLRKAMGREAADRRRTPRHDAVEPEVRVGWWSGDEFGAVDGRVRNISRGGAMIAVERKPPKDQPVWVYKSVGGAMACVRGEVVGWTPAPGGAYVVRLRFLAPCPTLLCQAVACARPSDD